MRLILRIKTDQGTVILSKSKPIDPWSVACPDGRLFTSQGTKAKALMAASKPEANINE
ncbi:hypothetical protein [Aureliella helgolandensis]|uniref:hypothetical protein n=1 Tax=Aureliella helgolandensis TaxID=2527968 RepID=UPI0018D1000F|nr:hypothetical protein [Aureliella helgolandensis]